MADSVGKILEQLRCEETRLEKEVDSAAKKVRSAKEGLKRVRSGIAALSGESKSTNGKPSPKKKDVQDAVKGLLTKHGTLRRPKLETLLKETLKANGFSLNGVTLRLREVLESDTVAVDVDSVKLPLAKNKTPEN